MIFYLADSVVNVENTRKIAKQLRELGHEVTSSWLDQNFEGQTKDPTEDINICKFYARKNIEDIEKAEVLIIFFFEGMKSAGKNVEFGYAYANGIPIYTVGEWNSVFHALADYHFKDNETLLKFIITLC